VSERRDARSPAIFHLGSAAACVFALVTLPQGSGTPLAIGAGGALGLIVAAKRPAPATWLPTKSTPRRRAQPSTEPRSESVVHGGVAIIAGTLVILLARALSSPASAPGATAVIALVLTALYASAGVWGLEELQATRSVRYSRSLPPAGIAFVGLMLALAAITIGSLGWRLWQWHELDTRGQAAVASVLSTNVSGPAETNYGVRIAFDGGSKHVEEQVCVTADTYARATRDGHVDVRFLPDTPTMFRIESDEGCFSPNLLLLTATFCLILAALGATMTRSPPVP